MKNNTAPSGGIEGGGTKSVCAIGSDPENIQAGIRFPTTTPEETLDQAMAFFKSHGDLAAMGIASYGSLDFRHDSPTYGRVLPTPKPHWHRRNGHFNTNNHV